MDYLRKRKEELHPDLRKVWEAAGFKNLRDVGGGIR